MAEKEKKTFKKDVYVVLVKSEQINPAKTGIIVRACAKEVWKAGGQVIDEYETGDGFVYVLSCGKKNPLRNKHFAYNDDIALEGSAGETVEIDEKKLA